MDLSHCGMCFRLCPRDLPIILDAPEEYKECIDECCRLDDCLFTMKCLYVIDNTTAFIY